MRESGIYSLKIFHLHWMIGDDCAVLTGCEFDHCGASREKSQDLCAEMSRLPQGDS